jgi:hypothetical protein
MSHKTRPPASKKTARGTPDCALIDAVLFSVNLQRLRRAVGEAHQSRAGDEYCENAALGGFTDSHSSIIQ